MYLHLLGPLTNQLLMKVARHELAGDELLQLGVFLKMKRATIERLIGDSNKIVSSTFAILEEWRNNATAVSSVDMFEEMCAAYLELKKTDVVEYLRRGK